MAILLSNIDYRSLVNVWPVHVVLTWGLVLPTLVIRNVTIIALLNRQSSRYILSVRFQYR